MDEKNKKILDCLMLDSRMTTRQISKKTNIPITTVHKRIQKLKQNGVIKRFTLELDYKKLEKGMASYILVSVKYTDSSGNKLSQSEIAKKIKALGVEEVSIVAGGTDIVIKIRVKDVDELNNFVIKKLRDVEGVKNTQTLVVLSEQ